MKIESLPGKLWRTIHTTPWLADLAYDAWKIVYGPKERFTPRSRSQKPNPNTGLYDMLGLNISTTEICNSACGFCVYPLIETPKKPMSNEQFYDIIREWARFGGNPRRAVNLTPGTPPGECLTDPGFEKKLKIVAEFGYKTFFVTNGILLHKHIGTILEPSNTVEAISVSIGSLDPEMYHKIFNVDRCEQVKKGIFAFLSANALLGWPVDTTICFRNAEKPSGIIKHPDFKRLEAYFGPRCKVMFTTWWDDWGGQVSKEKLEHGEIRRRIPLNLPRVCEGALTFSMRPSDRNIRFCGCRYLKDTDDQIVGTIDEGFAVAQKRMLEHHENFKLGIRVKTCQNCGAYKQA